MVSLLVELIARAMERADRVRAARRWQMLRRRGMRIGAGVELPASTWVDAPHAYLISIGDRCTFGEECLLLAHDAQMDEFLDAGRIGRITIHEDSRIGHRCTVLPGVEVGPRTVVLPHSVVGKTLPPDTVCSGNPARVVSSLGEWLEKQRAEQGTLPGWDDAEFARLSATPAGRAQLAAAAAKGGWVRRAAQPAASVASAR